MQRMNKEFDDRYTTLKNRIEILKREEKIYKNQLKIIKMKEQKEQRIQIDKIKLRLELNKVKENHNKKLNISKLSFKDLKKVSKKTNFPIILLNPFASSKDQLLINDIHLGIAQKYQKD